MPPNIIYLTKSFTISTNYGIDPRESRSKSWDEFPNENCNLILTVCDQAAGENCPLFPSSPKILPLSIPDPAQVTDTEEKINTTFGQAFHLLKTHIKKELLP